MNPNPSPPAEPFQFRILDFWVLLGLISADYFGYHLGHSYVWGVPYEIALKAGGNWHVFVIPLVGWLLVLNFWSASLKEGWSRVASLTCRILPFALVFSVFMIPYYRVHMLAGESLAIVECKTIHAAQQAFFKTHRAYANSLHPLYEDGLISNSLMNAEHGPSAIPHGGYLFKILTAQGAGARGGVASYVDSNGQLTRGFAITATPISWDCSGRNTFIMGSDGSLYQRDTGSSSPPPNYDPKYGGIWIFAE